MAKHLTDTQAKALKSGSKPVPVGGVPGLRLIPGKHDGRGKYELRFTSPVTGKRRDMGLGNYPEISLAKIRIVAIKQWDLVREGRDPIAVREEEKRGRLLLSQKTTFKQAAEIAYEQKRLGFRNEKHSKQWITTLQTHAYPTIGHVAVDALTPSHFADLLKPIWMKVPETADRVRQRCYAVMEHCIAAELIQHNPVQSVKKLLPQQKRTTKRHQPAVPYLRVPEVMNIIYPNAIEVSAGRSALAFAILTAARSGEVRKMTWDQINWEEAFWHIPAANTKTGEAHTVPISTQALEVLKQRQAVSECEGGEVFRSRNRGPLSDMTLTKVLRDNNIESDVPGRTATAHGFRSSFRDWAAENGYSFAIAEFALAHALKGNAVRPYYRTRHLNERIGMMQKWGDYVFSASSLWKSSGSSLKGKTA